MEDGLTFAYPQLRWDPEPVLQSYSAYTAYLDRLDSSFLASPDAPQRILYQPVTIDGRDPFWDPPAAQEAMYCHYAQVSTSAAWQVLRRVPDRCGEPEVAGRVLARFGQPIVVPAAGNHEMVVAEFSLTAPLSTKVSGLLLKPPPVQVRAWSRASASTYRFLPGTAGDPHVVEVPATLGYSAAFSPPALYRLEFSGGGWAAGRGSVRVTFLAVPMKP